MRSNGGRRHHDHRMRATTRPARSRPERHRRAPSPDRSRVPAAGLPGRGRGCRPGDLRPLVRHVPAAAASHRIPRRLADNGRQPHLPGCARLGTGPAGGRPGDAAADPAARVTLDESVAMAFLVVLESMTPAERLAFILHDVFGYPFADIAEITGPTPAACRQLASSARRRIRASQAPAAPAAHQAGIVRAFKQAWEASDIDALICLLDPAATVIGDGGGLVRAALRPI